VLQIIKSIRISIEQFINSLNLGMRSKLILIFLVIKIIPLVILTVLAWNQARVLGKELNRRTQALVKEANEALITTGNIAVEDSVIALNISATEQLERRSTDLARRVAEFLYERDDDILYAAGLEPTEAAYRHFLDHKKSPIVKQQEWILAEDGKSWIPRAPLKTGFYSASSNEENNTNYHNLPKILWETEELPLYLEMTYVDLQGNEMVKAVSSDQMDKTRKNVANRLNTYVKAETYFEELKNLKPGEIYVSDVIGAYVPSRLIGMYTPENAEERGQVFRPEEEAYAGRENPNGKRFKGIIRWAAPVVRGGRIAGYVTMALDHDHIMEFVDHVTPMNERYVEMPSAFEGNYAFIWDYRCRNICHPRHHSIVGFNPETGEPEIPWLEDRIYNEWQASGLPYTEFIKDVPAFQAQSRSKKPAPELTAKGLVGLDGRYLNNAPQCTGWFDLTKEGGSGSFLILWSGIWKPNTAATIPYYTGNYGKTKRGFGFVAIGAGLEDFQRPALQTKAALDSVIGKADQTLISAAGDARKAISNNLLRTTVSLLISASIMILFVVIVAIWMASSFTNSITGLNNGISRFRSGERQFRFNSPVKDEIGVLADSFDEMADSLVAADRNPLVIINMEQKIIYANQGALEAMGKLLEEVIGRPYREFSRYPPDPLYNPIIALKEGWKPEIFYVSDRDQFIRGKATYLKDKDRNNIGYIITTLDVTEMVNQQKELERAVTEANNANAHKGEFLARMSHEIRTPMNVIIGMTNIVKKLLAEDSLDLNTILNNISQIEVSSQHLLGLLNDILDISKIEAGKIELSSEPVDLLKLANTVVTIIKPRCDEKNITFDTHFDLPRTSHLCDPLRLRQVLINLLGNAVKFTPEVGRVSFSIVVNKRNAGISWVTFSVKDTGIGISEEALQNLFKPFEQANKGITQKYGGTGLGLVISKSIVQLFGGDITVRSNVGEGSEFFFELTLQEIASEDEEEIAVENIKDKLQGKRALLADDVAINRMIAISLLEETGIEIDEAEDGVQAVELFNKSAQDYYDIIYMDIQMPNLDGYSATAQIRALERQDAKTIPIVALTANAFKEDIDKAITNGMNAHLAKPLEPDKMMEVTLRLLRTRAEII
jgi:signal transduction histidine kinase/CheY-like chemotaxis protein/HAMP domain-containing protein